jgi:hypothetical protein
MYTVYIITKRNTKLQSNFNLIAIQKCIYFKSIVWDVLSVWKVILPCVRELAKKTTTN